MSENRNGIPIRAPLPQEGGGVPAAPGDGEVPEWLKGLGSEEDRKDMGLPPVGPARTDTTVVREENLPDWLRPTATLTPDAGKQVIEGTVVAAPPLNVKPPEAPAAPGDDEGKGPGEGGAKIEPRAKKSSEALEKEQSLLNEFKLAHEISAQAAACAERPWPESVEAIKGRREVSAAALSSLKEAMNGVALAPGDELQVRAQRENSARKYLELQRTIDGLNVAGLEKRADDVLVKSQKLETESSAAYREVDAENIKVAQEVKAWTQAEETAKANGLPQEGLAVFQLQRRNAKDRLTAIKAKAGYLFLEADEKKKEAERAKMDFEAAQINIKRLDAEKVQARLAAENWQKKLVDPERQLAGMRQQAAGLEKDIAGLDNILQTENIYTEVSEVADAFDQLNPSFIHQGGVEADLLQAMREGFPGTQVERDYIFAIAQQPEYANMTIPQLQQVFRDRVGKMNRILELEAAGAPEDMVMKLLTDPNYPDFPASFRSAVESTLRGRSFLAELPQGSDPVLSRANRAQRKVYTDIMFTLGLKPQTPEASEAQHASMVERAGTGDLAKQMAELYAGESLPAELQDAGAEYGTEAWENWKEQVMKWSRDKVHQQQLDNYANPKLAAAATEAATKQAELEGEAAAAGKRAILAEARVEDREDALRQTQQQVENLTPLAGEVQAQITSALESAAGALGAASTPDALGAPLAAGESLVSRLQAIEAWRGEELKRQLDEQKRGLGIDPETGKAGEGREHEKWVSEVGRIIAEAVRTGKVDSDRLRSVPNIGPVLAQALQSEMDKLGRNKENLSEAQIKASVGGMRQMVEAVAAAGVGGVGAMAPLLDGFLNLALQSMNLSPR